MGKRATSTMILQPGKPNAYKSSYINFLKTTSLSILSKKSFWKENIAPDVTCQIQGTDAEGKTCSSETHRGILPPPHWWESSCHLGPLIKSKERRCKHYDDAKATSQPSTSVNSRDTVNQAAGRGELLSRPKGWLFTIRQVPGNIVGVKCFLLVHLFSRRFSLLFPHSSLNYSAIYASGKRNLKGL